MSKIIPIVIILIFVGGVGGFLAYQKWDQARRAAINSFEACAEAGYPVMESYPARCAVPGGATFTQSTPTPTPASTSTPSPTMSPLGSPTSELIQVTSPTRDAQVSSPIEIRGQARGPWYFEASFPVAFEDAQGNILAQTPAQAQGEWMTEAWVPFAATLTLPTSFTGPGTVVFEKSNPSGLPEHAAIVRVPVVVE